MALPSTPAQDAEIKRLEGMDYSKMTKQEKIWHEQAIKDAYFHRRRVIERLLGEEPTTI